jgi:hypothetical protein
VPLVPLGTSYITPQMLMNAPTGVSWSIIPRPKATTAEVNAEVENVCWRATSTVDTYARQVLRSTIASEELRGPGIPRCNVDRNTGNGVLQAKWWPVTEVLAIQVSPSRAFPPVWAPVPDGLWRIRHPLISVGDSASATAPDGGWTIDVAPGWITWYGCGRGPVPGSWTGGGGRGGTLVQVCYLNGWPHTSLTEAANDGDTEVSVDDVTGWTGTSGFAYDGAATEQMAGGSVSADTPVVLPYDAGTAQGGPGTITLTSPLNFDHAAGTVISALPADVIYAAILAAAVQALTGGTDSITIQSLSGEHSSPQPTAEGMTKQYRELLSDYRRIM